MTVTLLPDAVEHTFTNGSTALIHPKLPWMVMLRQAAEADDLALLAMIDKWLKGKPIKDPAVVVSMHDAIVCAMFVEPRVHRRGTEELAEDEWTVDLVADSVYGEVLELALREVRAAATFRAGGDADGGGADGEGLADDAEPDPGAPAGEPVGVGDG
jgi:hypothetical protein